MNDGRPRVIALTRLASLRLRAAATGRVHSVFDGAINLELHAGALAKTSGLVVLHGPGALRAPFAVACDRLAAVSAGAAVTCESGTLRAGRSTWSIDGADVVDGSWAPALDGHTVLARLPIVEPTFPLLGERARALGAAIAEADPRAFERSARALLGLGPGLTPSGDDCLVGALAALWCHGERWREPLRHVGTSLAASARSATTVVAAEFVACALDEAFSEPLQAAVARGDAGPLLAFGATSGRDTLLGVRTALAALA